MASNSSNMYKMIVAYEKTGVLPKNMSEKKMEQLVKEKKEKERKEKLTQRKIIAQNTSKLATLHNVLKTVENEINEMAKSANIKIPDLKFNNTVSSGSADKEMLINITSNQVNFNINLDKFSGSFLEDYSKIFALVQKSVFTSEQLKEIEQAKAKEKNANIQNFKDEIVRRNAFTILSRYVSTYLKKHFGENQEESNLDSISKIITRTLLSGMSTEEIEKVINKNFNFTRDLIEKEAKNTLGNKKIDLYDGKTEQPSGDELFTMRLDSLHEEAMAYSGAGVPQKAISAHQQYQALLGDDLKSKFKDMNNMGNLQDFCSTFVANFCKANGLNPIAIKFNNPAKSDAMGEYHDAGKSQWIEINLPNVDSVVELSATLSHELTHAVDSSLNKLNGVVGKGQTGLVNDISENVSNSGFPKGSEAYKLLNSMNNYCYYVNPNERHARQGELSGYMLMLNYAKTDPHLMQQLKESIYGKFDHKTGKVIGGYIQYQEKTIKKVQELDAFIASARAQFASMGNLSDKPGYQMIKERLDYLEKIKEEFSDLSADRAALNSVRNLESEVFGNSNDTIVPKQAVQAQQAEQIARNEREAMERKRKMEQEKLSDEGLQM